MKLETKCIQAGYEPKNGESRMIPIIQSTTFKYDTSEDMGKLFDLEASGYFYTRLQNPTNDLVAAKLCALEGGTAAMLTSSGQAANFFAIFSFSGSRSNSTRLPASIALSALMMSIASSSLILSSRISFSFWVSAIRSSPFCAYYSTFKIVLQAFMNFF